MTLERETILMLHAKLAVTPLVLEKIVKMDVVFYLRKDFFSMYSLKGITLISIFKALYRGSQLGV